MFLLPRASRPSVSDLRPLGNVRCTIPSMRRGREHGPLSNDIGALGNQCQVMVLFITNVLGREKTAVPVWGGGL
jgi:hypothetical protein